MGKCESPLSGQAILQVFHKADFQLKETIQIQSLIFFSQRDIATTVNAQRTTNNAKICGAMVRISGLNHFEDLNLPHSYRQRAFLQGHALALQFL